MHKAEPHLQAMLLHGLHMHAWAMLPTARLLEAHRIRCRRFGYYSVTHTAEQHCRRLADAVRAYYGAHSEPLHFVCHSLGGIVLRRFAAEYPELVRGRCVTLGTPHLGSIAAERLHRYAPALIGGAYRNALDGNLPAWPPQIDLGCIAGSRHIGLGLAVGLTRGGDGSVLLEETRPECCRDYLVLPVSHTGILADKAAAAQTAHFLRHGRFRHPRDPHAPNHTADGS